MYSTCLCYCRGKFRLAKTRGAKKTVTACTESNSSRKLGAEHPQYVSSADVKKAATKPMPSLDETAPGTTGATGAGI